MSENISVNKLIEPVIQEESGKLEIKGEIEIVIYFTEELKKFLMCYLSKYLNKDYRIFYVDDSIIENRKNIKITKVLSIDSIENEEKIKDIIDKIKKDLNNIIEYIFMLEKIYNNLSNYRTFEYVEGNRNEENDEE